MPLLPYQESIPPAPLASWAEALWHSSVDRAGTLRLLPSASMQLLAYANQYGRGLAIIGPMSRFQLTKVRAGESFFGVRLCVGTRIVMTGLDSAAMKDARIFGSELVCPPITAFETAWAASTEAIRLDLLAQLTLALIEQNYLTRDPLVDRFISRARAANGDDTIERLAAGISLSERQLRRRFESYAGMTPKTFLKLCRQQAAVRELKRSTGTIASIAAAYGYSDQAHFSNEFRDLIGVTPLTLDDELTLE